MTNFEYIKNMSAEEFAHKMLNPCDNYSCNRCPMKDKESGICVLNSNEDDNDAIAVEWLNKEREQIE